MDEDGNVRAIVEQKAATPEQLAIREINSGIYCFRADLLWKHIAELKPDNPAHELYLTDMAAILNRHKHSVQQLHVADASDGVSAVGDWVRDSACASAVRSTRTPRPTRTPHRKITTETTVAAMNRNTSCFPFS